MRTWKRSALAVLLLSLLSLSLLQAQETTPEPAPTPEVTPEIIVPTDVLPTAAPSETPSPAFTDPTSEILPTEAAPTETVTATTPAAETTPEPTAETAPEPTAAPDPLSLVFSTGFEAAAPELNVQGWLAVDVDDGKALQSGLEASTLTYNTAYADAALSLRVLLNDGTLSLALRQNAASGYTFSLSSDSTARLLRDGLEIASAQVALVPGEWITLEARVIGGTLSASVNSVVVLNYTDAAPLPLGSLSVSSSAAALLRIDDLTILASGAGTPQSIPTTQPSETPTATQEATATKPAPMPFPSWRLRLVRKPRLSGLKPLALWERSWG